MRQSLRDQGITPVSVLEQFQGVYANRFMVAKPKEGYHSILDLKLLLYVPIFSLHQQFLHFAVCPLHFQFGALPFAPQLYTKAPASVLALLHTCSTHIVWSIWACY